MPPPTCACYTRTRAATTAFVLYPPYQALSEYFCHFSHAVNTEMEMLAGYKLYKAIEKLEITWVRATINLHCAVQSNA